jgi:hypothetical protein
VAATSTKVIDIRLRTVLAGSVGIVALLLLSTILLGFEAPFSNVMVAIFNGYGLEPTLVGLLVSVWSLSGLIAKPPLGVLADRLGLGALYVILECRDRRIRIECRRLDPGARQVSREVLHDAAPGATSRWNRVTDHEIRSMRHSLHRRVGLFDGLQQLLSERNQRRTRRSRNSSLRRAREEFDSEPSLHAGDSLGDRGLRVVQLVRRPGDAAVLDNTEEHRKILRAEHRRRLLS